MVILKLQKDCLILFTYTEFTFLETQSIHFAARHFAARVEQREPSVKTLRFQLSANFFEALRNEWLNSTPSFCLGAGAQKLKNGIKPRTVA